MQTKGEKINKGYIKKLNRGGYWIEFLKVGKQYYNQTKENSCDSWKLALDLFSGTYIHLNILIYFWSPMR